MNKMPVRFLDTDPVAPNENFQHSEDTYIDVEFSDVVQRQGRRGYNGRALEAADIREEFSRRHGKHISMDDADYIARMRSADEAAIQSEPLALIGFAALILGCLLLALCISAASLSSL